MATWQTDDGTLIYYEQHGEGANKPTLLLLPGLLGAISSQWRAFVAPLAESFRVVLMDLRGHGRSENSQTVLEPQRLVEDICSLLDFLAVETVHVAGYSIGGYLGLMLYLNQPRRVSTLLMHGTKFYWSQEAVAKMCEQLDPDAMVQKVPGYADQLVREHGSRWRPLVRQASDLIAMLGQEGITEGMVKRVQIPVLVSVGDRDELVTLPEAMRLSRIFRRGGLLVLPGVHHPLPSVPLIPLLPMMNNFHQQQAQQL